MTSNAGWPRRVALATGAAALVICVALYALWGPLVALGYAGGVLTGAGMLSALVFVLKRVTVPPEERPRAAWAYVVLHVGKFGLAAAAACLVIVVWRGSAVAFAAGYTVALIALLIALGRGGADMHTGGPTWD